jgi:hypothetical protein
MLSSLFVLLWPNRALAIIHFFSEAENISLILNLATCEYLARESSGPSSASTVSILDAGSLNFNRKVIGKKEY